MATSAKLAYNWNNQSLSTLRRISAQNRSAGVSQARTGSFGSSSGSSPGDLFSRLQGITAANNAWSAAQAQKQMDFQASQGAIARQFNHDEAELSRLWQERMSNTAHQREIQDLKAAGLNPVLSAMGGGGAPVTSGSTASGYSPGSGSKGDTDTSLVSALVSLLGASMQAEASIANTAVSAKTQENVARINQETSFHVAAIQSSTTLSAANISSLSSQAVASIYANAQVSSSFIAAEASKVNAALSAATQRYGYDLSAMTQKDLAKLNYVFQSKLKEKGFDYDLALQKDAADNQIRIVQTAPTTWAGQLNSDAFVSNLGQLFGFSDDGFSYSGKDAYGGRRR